MSTKIVKLGDSSQSTDDKSSTPGTGLASLEWEISKQPAKEDEGVSRSPMKLASQVEECQEPVDELPEEIDPEPEYWERGEFGDWEDVRGSNERPTIGIKGTVGGGSGKPVKKRNAT